MKSQPCPRCKYTKSRVTSYDGDYWRACKVCGFGTEPHQSADLATADWNDRRTAKEIQKAKRLAVAAYVKKIKAEAAK